MSSCIGVFFDHKTFEAEQLIVGARHMPLTQLLAMAPLSDARKTAKPVVCKIFIYMAHF